MSSACASIRAFTERSCLSSRNCAPAQPPAQASIWPRRRALHVDVHARFFTREEIEPKTTFTKNSRAHRVPFYRDRWLRTPNATRLSWLEAHLRSVKAPEQLRRH